MLTWGKIHNFQQLFLSSHGKSPELISFVFISCRICKFIVKPSSSNWMFQAKMKSEVRITFLDHMRIISFSSWRTWYFALPMYEGCADHVLVSYLGAISLFFDFFCNVQDVWLNCLRRMSALQTSSWCHVTSLDPRLVWERVCVKCLSTVWVITRYRVFW